MNKYKVCIPLDYISGHLRYGHYELIFESEEELTKEEIKQTVEEISKALGYEVKIVKEEIK